MRNGKYLILPAALLLILVYNALIYVQRASDKTFPSQGNLFKFISVRNLLITLVLITLYVFFIQYYIWIRNKRSVTPLAIK